MIHFQDRKMGTAKQFEVTHHDFTPPPKKKKSHSNWEIRVTDFRLLWKKRTCPLVVRRGVKGSQPRDCNVKCLYPYRAASVSVAFILSVVSAVVPPPPHQPYQSAPQLLAVRAAATGMRNTGSTEKPFSQLCLDTCRRYDDRGF